MIAIGCDHGGYRLKKVLIQYLEEHQYQYKDLGTNSEDPVDYPIYAKRVVESMTTGESERGIIICGTGIGISIMANRHKKIRAALCSDCFSAQAARLHNDANVLALGGRVVDEGLAVDILKIFLETPFSDEERHLRRVSMLEGY